MRSSPWLRVAAAYVAIALVAGLLASLGGGGAERPPTPAQKRAKRADVGGPFPLELRSPQVVAGTSERVLVALGRPSLADLMTKSRQSPSDQRAYVRSLHREARALMSALNAKGVRFGRPVLFARVWSGFAATIATRDLPAVQTLGLRVEPVSRFYPAQVPAKDAPAVRPLPARAASAGRVAVLDAFPRSASVAADEVGSAGARPSPGEHGGERLAAVVLAELPGARIDAIRTAGSQPLENGRFDVYATTDQLLAALERAVDRDQNGDVDDAAAVALTGLSAPYSGFADSPAAEAVDAATALGTLVVAPAGNGGKANGPFGTIGAPGAAAGALTVAALDGSGAPAPASSRGPTYGLAAKPDLAIGSGAKTAAGAAWGTAIAAARVAGVATALRAERPSLTPADVAAALVGTAAPRGPLLTAGGGDPLLQAAVATQVVARPRSLVLPPGATASVRLRNLSSAAVPLPGAGSIPPHGTGLVPVRAPQRPGPGRVQAGPVAIPFDVVGSRPPAPPLGALSVVHRRHRPAGVRFTAGTIKRGDKGVSVVPVGNLVLTLEGPGRRELTPPGGARDLLPGEYAYTLTDEVLGSLPRGRYRFVVRARGSAGGAPVVRRSKFFRIG